MIKKYYIRTFDNKANIKVPLLLNHNKYQLKQRLPHSSLLSCFDSPARQRINNVDIYINIDAITVLLMFINVINVL